VSDTTVMPGASPGSFLFGDTLKYLSGILLLCLLLPTGLFAEAQRNADLRGVLSQLGVSAPPESLAPAPLPGFLQVVRGVEVLYISVDGALLIDGDILDVAGEVNLTERSRAAIRRDLLASVPADERIVMPAGEARGSIVVFTDTSCPYCRRLHEKSAEFAARGIEIQYLLYPRPGPGSESFAQAVAVWCSPDRLSALGAALGGATLPSRDCDNPVMRHYELARRLDLKGTPAIVAADGSVSYGIPGSDEVATLAGPPRD